MKLKILLLLLIITSIQLFADVSGEIYTSGYHDLIVNALNAVSGLAASNNAPLIKVASAIAVIIMTIKIIFNQNSRNIAGFEVLKMGTFILAIQALFISAPDDDNHAYAVIDRISLQTTEVRQIPKGIGEFLSSFTTLEDGIMQKMELYFTTPASLSYRQAGLGFTVSTQMDIMRSNIADTNLKKTFYDYILNCKVDGDFSIGNQNLQYLLSAEGTNIMTQLGTDRSTLTMVYSNTTPSGEVVSCKDAWSVIKSALDTEALNNQTSIAKARGLLSQTFANDVAMSNMITGSTSATVSARDQLVSAIARNATLDSVKKVATFNGVSDSMLTKQLSISEISMTNSSILANYQAQQTVPVLKALSTAFIVVISWIIGILAIATMNAGYIKFLIVLNIWLMLWSPLFQVLNFAIDILVDDALALYPNGIDSNNQIGIYEILGGKLAMVTNLVWSVPILAFGIAKGGEFAMTQFISAMVAPVQGAAHHTTKTDLQTAMGENDGFTTGDGRNAHFGMANTNAATTGVGGQSSRINSSGNNVTDVAGTGVTKISSAANPNVSASIDNNGNVITKNDDASATQVSGASTALTSANAKVESLQNSLTKENSNVMSQMSTAGSSNTVTNTNGDSVKIDESTGQTIQKMNSAASKEALGSSKKDALVDSIKNDNNARTVLGVGLSLGSGKSGKNSDDKSDEEDTKGIVSALAKFSPVNAAISTEGSVVLTGSNGTSFELSKNSSYGKEFTENYSKSISDQMSKSKDNTQAYANMVSAVNGESQSDSNSTARKVSQAYSEQESASQTYQATKTQGTANGDNLMNSAFQTYFSKNADRFGNASKEEKADFMVNKMVEWNQSQNGIKDKMDFISDNTSKSELPNSVNTKGNIENGAKNLGSDVGSHVAGDTTFNPNSNASAKSGIENSGQEIRNTDVSNPELKSQVNNNVKKDGEVSEKVNEHSVNTAKTVGANQDKNANNINDSLMINSAKGVDNGMETIKETLKNTIGGGSDDRINPDIKRYADNNRVENESTYKNAKLGKENLIEHGYVRDEINKTQLGKASTEDLARIYNHDKNNHSLSNNSKSALKDELGKRGYDVNSNEYSSKYEGETIKKDSIIPNGDGGNPGSSARKLENDFPSDFKPSF